MQFPTLPANYAFIRWTRDAGCNEYGSTLISWWVFCVAFVGVYKRSFSCSDIVYNSNFKEGEIWKCNMGCELNVRIWWVIECRIERSSCTFYLQRKKKNTCVSMCFISVEKELCIWQSRFISLLATDRGLNRKKNWNKYRKICFDSIYRMLKNNRQKIFLIKNFIVGRYQKNWRIGFTILIQILRIWEKKIMNENGRPHLVGSQSPIRSICIKKSDFMLDSYSRHYNE